jgi:hypothetical protein
MKTKNSKRVLTGIVIAALIILAIIIFYCIHRQFSYIELEDGTLEVQYYLGKDSEIYIPSKAWGKKVTSINTKFLYKTTTPTTLVYIPDTVTKIGEEAFMGIKNIKITGGENVEEIGAMAFMSTVLTDEFPYMENLKIIGNSAFEYCKGINTFKLSETVEYIGGEAFDGSEISQIEIPDGITYIGSHAFSNTSYIDETDDFLIVGDNILINFPSEDILVIPYGIKYISNTQYNSDNVNIKEIYIPDTVVRINEYLLHKTDGVKIYIPSSVEQIGGLEESYGSDDIILSEMDKATLVVESGSYAESYAIEKGLNYEIVDSIQDLYDETVKTKKDITLLDGDYEYSIGLNNTVTIKRYLGENTDVAFPSAINGMSVTRIGDGTKSVCKYDTVIDITIPDTVTSIGSQSFCETKWFKNLKGNIVVGDGILIRRENYDDYNNKNIWIPQGVKTMLNDNMNDESTENIYIPDSVETIEKGYFANIIYANVYIPPSVTNMGNYSDEEISECFGEGLRLMVEEGSYAHQFAIENNLEYKVVDDIQAVYENIEG